MLVAPVAQWIERRPSKPQVVGSSPTGGVYRIVLIPFDLYWSIEDD